MERQVIVAIDNDTIFLEGLRSRLDDVGALNRYSYYPINVRGGTTAEVVNYCIEEMKKILTEECTIELVLVDLVIFERSEPPEDRSGLDVARSIRAVFPEVPMVGITRFIKAYQLLSEATLDPNVQGILLKSFLMDMPEFSG